MKLLILVDNKNAIAKDGKQIMFVDNDLEMFKNYTTNNIIVMGRKTLDDIGRQLPNRISVVFTRSEKEDKKDLFYIDSVEKLDKIIGAYPDKEVFVIGGAEIVKLLWDRIDELIVTRVDTVVEGADTFIPDFDGFKLIDKSEIEDESYRVYHEKWVREKVKGGPSMANILIVEDEEKLLKSIKEGLVHSGYAVDTALDGDEGSFMAFTNSYDLIILDVNLPGKNGFEILEEIRERDREVNVIMLTALSDVDDRVRGLDLGANDYILKPFHFEELKARIRSLLRRKTSISDTIIRAHGVEFDTAKRTFAIDKEALKLTAKEAGILEYLFFNLGRYVTAEELMDHVWNDEVDLFSNVVRVHMSALRKKLKDKLGKNIIRNEIGKGYIIDEEN